MSFKVKDKVTIFTSKDRIIEGTISSIVDGRVYAVKFLNDKNEQDLYWVEPTDMIVVDDASLIGTSSTNCSIILTADSINTSSPASLRYNSNKIQTREVDPKFILGIGDVLTKSREKYPEMNWSLPTKYSTPYDSAMRHLQAFWGGEDFDSESGKHHLLHAATNLMFLYFHVRQEDPASDDRGFKGKK